MEKNHGSMCSAVRRAEGREGGRMLFGDNSTGHLHFSEFSWMRRAMVLDVMAMIPNVLNLEPGSYQLKHC